MKNIFVNSIIVAAALASVQGAMAAASDTESALATITVRSSLDLEKVNDLNFPAVSQGDPSYTVQAEDPEAATFTVAGEANASYSTIIEEATVEMTTDLGDIPQKKIVVDSFAHNSPEQLDALGTASFGVGARHEDILADQVAGSYEGIFNVTVSYQ